MSRILITSGPTREYLDPVRYISNASSGRMGAALAQAAIDAGHHVRIVSGPVHEKYPDHAEVIRVVSTEEMLAACQEIFPDCDGLIAVAAPCDYRPATVAPQKIRKTGDSLHVELVETPDIVAALAKKKKSNQWLVAFALETEDQHLRAMKKMERKQCDLMILNGPTAINSTTTSIELLAKDGKLLGTHSGDKNEIAKIILETMDRFLIKKTKGNPERQRSPLPPGEG
jgi:phosphopantothenoylcysteine decarboxylase/phosphopantothenate--cysteine ligase